MSKLLEKKIDINALWHAYIIRGYCNLPYNINTMVGNESSMSALREYLKATYGNDEWGKAAVLDLIRNTSRSAIRSKANQYFRSIFRKNRTAYPLQIPDEYPNLTLNLDAINKLAVRKKEPNSQKQKGQIFMEPDTSLSGIKIQLIRLVDTGEITKGGNKRRRSETVTVDAGELTLDNFSALTGRRFRMSQEQKSRLDKDRETAFREWLSEAVAAACQNQNVEVTV